MWEEGVNVIVLIKGRKREKDKIHSPTDWFSNRIRIVELYSAYSCHILLEIENVVFLLSINNIPINQF